MGISQRENAHVSYSLDESSRSWVASQRSLSGKKDGDILFVQSKTGDLKKTTAVMRKADWISSNIDQCHHSGQQKTEIAPAKEFTVWKAEVQEV